MTSHPAHRLKQAAKMESIGSCLPPSSVPKTALKMESIDLPSQPLAVPKRAPPPPRALPCHAQVEVKKEISVESGPKELAKPPAPKKAPPQRQLTDQVDPKMRSPTPEPRGRRVSRTPSPLPSFSEFPRNVKRMTPSSSSMQPPEASVPSAPKTASARSRTPSYVPVANRDLDRLGIQLEDNIASAQHIMGLNRDVPSHELDEVLRVLRLARDTVGSFSRRQIERLRDTRGSSSRQ